MRRELKKAIRVSSDIAAALPGQYPAIEAFSKRRLEDNFVRECRNIEREKTYLKNKGVIDSNLYFDIVFLERFSNDQLDDCLAGLKKTLQCAGLAKGTAHA